MCEVIRHRGPDDEGMHVESGVGLGMRRLSIIDLSTGHQPIHNEDETVWLVFNGEIYNYRELRAELERHGHRFYTASDTETIVHAYEQWGEDCFAKLRGMFGIALWDRPKRTLLLARDRAGIKPLHYAHHRDRLYFGSELKSLIAAGAVDGAIDFAALDHYLSFLYTPRDRSIFKGVCKLPPGHFLRWRDGRAVVRRTGRSARARRSRGRNRRRRWRLRGVLADAVRSHMISDVPLGAFLSGGVDSSAVVGLMAQASDRPVKTFSIGFDVAEFDELEHARAVAAALRHRASRVRRAARRLVDPRSLDRALRRAVRGLVRDPDVVRVRDCPPARDGRAVGRRRRRAVRRLRPLPAASARRAVRPAAGAGRRPWPARSGRCCRTACRARTSCATWRATTTGATSTRSRFFHDDEKRALYSTEVRAALGPQQRRRRQLGPALRSLCRRCRRTAA